MNADSLSPTTPAISLVPQVSLNEWRFLQHTPKGLLEALQIAHAVGMPIRRKIREIGHGACPNHASSFRAPDHRGKGYPLPRRKRASSQMFTPRSSARSASAPSRYQQDPRITQLARVSCSPEKHNKINQLRIYLRVRIEIFRARSVINLLRRR